MSAFTGLLSHVKTTKPFSAPLILLEKKKVCGIGEDHFRISLNGKNAIGLCYKYYCTGTRGHAREET
ncbi:hypothetical protein MMALV_05850 [Candidatus Methanomethylophilus alvi Mx1201]|uniref:Uncharacterized protein n=1 Tax=Methanomethylophilus alvi (strain Mx1201) TaxID=1236689 RepID=M9SAG2_METAX|nr:hypothetical protein MMALV_05850 [Candidatus Methanomethylophilus alvi Mx1201]